MFSPAYNLSFQNQSESEERNRQQVIPPPLPPRRIPNSVQPKTEEIMNSIPSAPPEFVVYEDISEHDRIIGNEDSFNSPIAVAETNDSNQVRSADDSENEPRKFSRRSTSSKIKADQILNRFTYLVNDSISNSTPKTSYVGKMKSFLFGNIAAPLGSNRMDGTSDSIRKIGKYEVRSKTSESGLLVYRALVFSEKKPYEPIEVGNYSTSAEATEACISFAVPKQSPWGDQNCQLCRAVFGLVSRRKHHCKNCGRTICAECSKTFWPASMLPFTYNWDKKEIKCRICDLCAETNENFRRALIGGNEEEAMDAYQLGCVNLRCPYTIYENELPVHCAAKGGSLPLLAWLIDEKRCPLFKEAGMPLGDRKKDSVMTVAAAHGHTHIMRYLLISHGCKTSEIKNMKVLQNVLEKALLEGGTDPNPTSVPFTKPNLKAAESSLNDIVIAEATDANECIICFERERDCTIVPCGHHACCQKCADLLEECPICRVNIESRVKTIMC